MKFSPPLFSVIHCPLASQTARQRWTILAKLRGAYSSWPCWKIDQPGWLRYWYSFPWRWGWEPHPAVAVCIGTSCCQIVWRWGDQQQPPPHRQTTNQWKWRIVRASQPTVNSPPSFHPSGHGFGLICASFSSVSKFLYRYLGEGLQIGIVGIKLGDEGEQKLVVPG